MQKNDSRYVYIFNECQLPRPEGAGILSQNIDKKIKK